MTSKNLLRTKPSTFVTTRDQIRRDQTRNNNGTTRTKKDSWTMKKKNDEVIFNGSIGTAIFLVPETSSSLWRQKRQWLPFAWLWCLLCWFSYHPSNRGGQVEAASFGEFFHTKKGEGGETRDPQQQQQQRNKNNIDTNLAEQ